MQNVLPDQTGISDARNQLWKPRMPLMSCMRGVLGRSTVGIALADDQRYNHFPATPACTLSWFFTGHSELLEAGHKACSNSPRAPLADRVVFGGPQNRPTITWNPGPVHAMMLLLLPDALHALTGIDPGAYVNRLVPACEVFGSGWMEFCASLFEAGDDDSRVALIDAFLEPLWQKARPHGLPGSHMLEDWSNGLALHAASSGLGRSVRQIDRRIKRWTGQPLRELRGMGRSERAFFDTITAIEQGDLNWSHIAEDAGYSDQSHLCRQIRRITGFSPEELRRGIAEDECFWLYRLWGFGDRS